MTLRSCISLFVLLPVLMFIGLISGGPRFELTSTSYGNVPAGHGALFDLLRELDLPIARSYAAPDTLEPDTTVWWIEPHRICGRWAADPDTGDDPLRTSWDPVPWIEEGGTAIVFLPPRPVRCLPDVRLAGAAAPVRAIDRLPVDDEEAEPEADPIGALASEPEVETWQVDGEVAVRTRTLEGEQLVVFEPTRGWETVVQVGGAPFAVRRPLHSGQLVLVADGSFLENRWLDRADSALLAIDLIAAFGTPRIDEREHGIRPTENGWVYLATSAAMPLILGAALLLLVLLWRRSSLPPRTLDGGDEEVPTLVTFVDSLASLYARTRDTARVLERYRELSASQLKRALGLPLDTPDHRLADHLRHTRGVSEESLAWLSGQAPADSSADLARATRALDRMVKDAVS